MRASFQIVIVTLAVVLVAGCSNKAKQAPPPEVSTRSAAPAEPEPAVEPKPGPEPEVAQAEADELAADELELGIPEICRNGGNGQIELSRVSFGFGEHALTDETRAVLEAHAECLQALPQLKIVLEGHCDERGTQEFNLALGNDRANAVRRFLQDLGISADRLRPLTKGKNSPLCDESTEACWARNRRVMFVPVSAKELASNRR